MTAKDLKNHTGEVLRRVRAGATIAITNRGRRVAVISPASLAAAGERAHPSSDSDTWAEIRSALAATTPEHADWREVIRRARGRP